VVLLVASAAPIQVFFFSSSSMIFRKRFALVYISQQNYITLATDSVENSALCRGVVGAFTVRRCCTAQVDSCLSTFLDRS
jgi:hypothetical protein